MTIAAGTVALNIINTINYVDGDCASLWKAFVDGFIDKDEKVASSKKNTKQSLASSKLVPVFYL